MGTRALIHVKDGRKTIATIYRQYDGYPTGLGEDVKKILNNVNVIILNGYNDSCATPSKFNGMGCLAAYLIGELKQKKIGNVYIMAPNTEGSGEDFTYILSQDVNSVKLKVIDSYTKKVLYNGRLKDFCGQKAEGVTSLEIELT
jgi:hypothetical protein